MSNIEKKSKESIFEIQEETKIVQENKTIILEKGDKIRVLDSYARGQSKYISNIANLPYNQRSILTVLGSRGKSHSASFEPITYTSVLEKLLDFFIDGVSEMYIKVHLFVRMRQEQPHFYIENPQFVHPLTGEMEQLSKPLFSADGRSGPWFNFRDKDWNDIRVSVRDFNTY